MLKQRYGVCGAAFTLAILLGWSEAGIEIPRDYCVWKTAHYGSFSSCDGDEVAVGGCGSGQDPSCDGKWTGLLCCRLPEFYYGSCDTRASGDYGAPINCPEFEGTHDIVEGVCGSGKGRDCSQASHEANCCQGHYQGELVGSSGQCTWIYTAEWGGKLECGRKDEAVMGVCQSGSNRDCPQGSVHGIYCCEMLVLPSE